MSINDCQPSVFFITELQAAYPDFVWRTDSVLQAPILIYPENERNFCFEVDNGNTNICLNWQAVPGATTYLVQWSLNPEMNGPSVQERIVSGPDTSYCLYVPTDIRQGVSVYWRVQAADLANGGVSPKSEIRTVTYNCNEDQSTDGDSTKCDKYNVQAEVNGRSYIGCCEQATFWLEASYDGQDSRGVNKILLTWVDWNISGDSAGEIIKQADRTDPNSNFKKIIIQSCSDETQIFEVQATLYFLEHTGETFECKAEPFRVIADCGDPDNQLMNLTISTDYRGENIGPLNACGTPVTLNEECRSCYPCCEHRNASFVTVDTRSDLTGIYTGQVAFNTTQRLYDPETCNLRYQTTISVLPGVLKRTIQILKSQDGSKTVNTPGTAENADSWIFELRPKSEYDDPNAPINIVINYDGCWSASNTPFFYFVLTEEGTAGQAFKIGYYVACSEVLPKQDILEVAHISGPVHAVTEIECSDDPWPKCHHTDGTNCVCLTGKVYAQYGEATRYIEPKENPEDADPVFYFDTNCACPDCIDGLIEVRHMGVTVDEDCNTISHSIEFQLTCEGVSYKRDFINVIFDCEDPDPSQITHVLSYCGCRFPIKIEAYEGSYGQDFASSAGECDCVQTEVIPCFTLGTDDGCLPAVKYGAGNWQTPNGRVEVGDTYAFGLANMEFDGCDLKAVVCVSNKDCTGFGFGACLCNTACSVFPKEINANIAWTHGTPSTAVKLLKADEFTGEYISQTVALEGPLGSKVYGKFYIANDKSIRFEGGPLGFSTNTYTGTVTTSGSCSNFGYSATLQITETTYVNGNPADPDQTATWPVTIAFSNINISGDCQCTELPVELEVEQCFPLKASGNVTFEGLNLIVSLGKEDEVVDNCGCTLPTALEARVNFPAGCGLTVSASPTDINQKAFAVDHKALVSHGDPQQSLEVFNRDEGCPSITLPICACVEWETVAGGKGGAELPKGYLFKGNIYEGRVLDQSVASTFELRLEVLSFGGQNPGYLGIVRLDNSTAATLNYGDVVYFSYTDDCNPKIIKTSLEEVTTTSSSTENPDEPDFEDPDNRDCEGSCRFTWTESTFTWTQTESTCATPTTPDPETQNKCFFACINTDIGLLWAGPTSDSCDPGWECDPGNLISGTPCSQEGATTSEPCIEGPAGGCSYVCKEADDVFDFDYWAFIGSDCQIEGEDCENAHLQIRHTNCSATGIGSTTIEPCSVEGNTTPCFEPEVTPGTCLFKCIDTGQGDEGVWTLMESNCNAGASCDDLLVGIPCYEIDAEVTPECLKPTTTTTSTTTSSTAPPTCGICQYRCNNLYIWELTANLCTSDANGDCECDSSIEGTECANYGDTRDTSCVPTTPEPECNCEHKCVEGADGFLRWRLQNKSSVSGKYCQSYKSNKCPTEGNTTIDPCIPVGDCHCVLPDICGETDGDCIITECLLDYALKGPLVMEECDPRSTSTTLTPEACGNCNYQCYGPTDGGPLYWQIYGAHTCSQSSTCDCEGSDGEYVAQPCTQNQEIMVLPCTSTTEAPTTTTGAPVLCCVDGVAQTLPRQKCCDRGGKIVADQQECDELEPPTCKGEKIPCFYNGSDVCKYRPVWNGNGVTFVMYEGCPGTDGRWIPVPCEDPQRCFYKCGCEPGITVPAPDGFDPCDHTLCCESEYTGTCESETICPPCPEERECVGACEWYYDGCSESFYWIGPPCPSYWTFPPGVPIPAYCSINSEYVYCYCPAPKPRAGCTSACVFTNCEPRRIEPPEEPPTEPPTTQDPSDPCPQGPDEPETEPPVEPEGPCEKYCVWQATFSSDPNTPFIWQKVKDECEQDAEDCNTCGEPDRFPQHACEIIKVKCGQGQDPCVPDESLIEPFGSLGLVSTSDTECSTTTTEGPCEGTCKWEVSSADSRWYLVESDCALTSDCNCPSDALAGEQGIVGHSFEENCGDPPSEPGRYCYYESNKVLKGCVTSFSASGSECSSSGDCPPKGTCCENGICTESVFRSDCNGFWKQYIEPTVHSCDSLSSDPRCAATTTSTTVAPTTTTAEPTTTTTATPPCTGTCDYICIEVPNSGGDGVWAGNGTTGCSTDCQCPAPEGSVCAPGATDTKDCINTSTTADPGGGGGGPAP